MMNIQTHIKVWDLPLRIFHWALVFSFLLAYITEDDFMIVHAYAGYTIMGLLIFRLIWGFIGTKYARFTDFVRHPKTVFAYLKEVLFNNAERYLGHNPAGGAMVIALLICLGLTTITGLAVYATEEGLGPLLSFMNTMPNFIFDAAEDVHEFFANVTVFFIVLHIIGVIVTGLSHNENLVKAMITGIKHAK